MEKQTGIFRVEVSHISGGKTCIETRSEAEADAILAKEIHRLSEWAKFTGTTVKESWNGAYVINEPQKSGDRVKFGSAHIFFTRDAQSASV